MRKQDAMSRRSFIEGGSVAAGAAMAAGISTAFAQEATEVPAWLPETWDGEADILIVGRGDAGLSAAVTAALENQGSVLMFEAAPEEEQGGNSRVSGQNQCVPDTPEDGITMFKAINEGFLADVTDEDWECWSQLCDNITWIDENIPELAGRMLMSDYDDKGNRKNSMEWPGWPGSDNVHIYLPDGSAGGERGWRALMNRADELGVPCLFATRIVDLIFNPVTKEVLGVRSEDGRAFKANKGVILACGGFEANPEMLAQYIQLGSPDCMPIGTPWNRGDGVKMCQKIGAKLWHMNNTSGWTWAIPGALNDTRVTCQNDFNMNGRKSKAFVHIDLSGRRFIYEEIPTVSRHGKIWWNGSWTNMPCPNFWMVVGQNYLDAGHTILPSASGIGWAGTILAKQEENPFNFDKTLEGAIASGLVKTGETFEELAEQIGVPVEAFVETMTTYNENAANNVDPQFGRGKAYRLYPEYFPKDHIAAFDLEPLQPPFYAVHIQAGILNTQGGPRRVQGVKVIDMDDNIIPRLYACGELGAIYPNNYNNGANKSDCWSTGRQAARAAGANEPWA